MDYVCSLMSPDRTRNGTGLDISQAGLQALAAAAQQQQQLEVAETPTPTKIIFPKVVTKAQENFAEGFQQALQQLQVQNRFVPTSTTLPSLFNILAAITPSLSQAPPLVPTSLNSPDQPQGGVELANSGSPSANAPGSAGTTSLSPLSNESVTSLANTATSSVASTNSSQSVNLADVQRKLTAGGQGYMDIFQQSELGFGNFIGHPSNALLPPGHLPAAPQAPPPQQQQQQQQQQQPHPNGYAPPPLASSSGQTVKAEPDLSVVSTLAAAMHNSYMPAAASAVPHPQPVGGGPQRVLGPPSTSADVLGYGQNDSLDLEEQERRKLERKRARNRMAASKCRQRKLERIQELETQLQQEREKNLHLSARAEFMRNRVDDLTKLVEQHRQQGCSLELPHWYRSPPLQHDMNL